jgi:hypothetical protein
MTEKTMNTEEFNDMQSDLANPADLEFDPARRREYLWDPARKSRKKGSRKMPAGLRRYWAARRAKHADPTHRRRRKHSYHPKRHRGRRLDPARRRFSFHRRGRRLDPAFGTSGGWVDIVTDYGMVAAGSVGHNFTTANKGYLSRLFNLGPVSMTQAGALAGGFGILAEKMGWIRTNGAISNFLKGIFAEGFNAPSVERVTRTGPGGGSYQPSSGPYSGPYYQPPWYGM